MYPLIFSPPRNWRATKPFYGTHKQHMNDTKPNQEGATVYAAVSAVCIGETLRRLEHKTDIQLMERRPHLYTPPDELWTLRSLTFPRAWDGALVKLHVTAGQNGLEVVPA